MWRNVASNALTFLVVAVFLFGGLLLWAQNEYSAEGPLQAPICLEVPRGTNMSRVSDNLSGQGAVSSALLFRLGADYTDRTQQLKAGSYLVPEGSSMSEIVDIVTRGGASTCGTEVVYRIGITRAVVEVREIDPETGRYEERAEFTPGEGEVPEVYTAVREANDTRYRVALAEGVTSWQVIEELKQVDILEGEVEVPEEGALAPDSYEITPGDTRASVIERMRQAQELILAEAWADRADGLPLESPEEALILASIIEKETGNAQERFDVASVFVNRLEQGMRLQTDPTVIYGITKGEGPLGRGLRQSELRGATPWNTYVIDGLPPTPIANPGRAAIEAALNPSGADYRYFVAKTLNPADGHNFAVTLDEHNSNVAAYRALERARDN
ncbi:endolytic transglycosylase MltG [Ponticoccus alexandrii]|uniref:Endolytic murein transglycosylase n=1 Tax=Ponticoccus alexandrii TaxID=1943633 RepID=A0ABX7F939_9RHOB|nr:endolytic transglycosylase MltG [Ponticoccus alexandrii]ETA52653.1 branched-chain alpha-keto acid dehydrogenase subunit E2 [Rhodobacteraceae bacterium PD-2]QRF67050.1 endolytic transglycosylase MltG [Ponticoccus alexandrii]